jgi:Baseplate J-like protein
MSLTINYTDTDYASILSTIQNALIANDPLWNDWLESNTGKVLVELFAAIADMNRFTLDKQAAETYITDVLIRSNAVKLVALLGLQPTNPFGLQTTVQFTLASSWPRTITIPQWTLLTGSTIPGVPFVTSEAVIIPISTLSVQVTAVQGTPATFNYVSTGAADQIVPIAVQDIFEGTFNLTVNGIAWALAPYNFLVGTQPTDQVYATRNMPDGTVQILFGDGVEGMIPLAGANIVITYLITQNTSVSAGILTINTIVPQIVDSSSIPVTGLSVTNIDTPAGSQDYENTQDIATRYPLRFSTLRRAVTLGDFQAFAQTYEGVIQALAYDVNSLPSLPPFEVLIYVAVSPIGSIPTALLDSLQAYLTSLASVDTVVVVDPVTTITINVLANIYVYRRYSSVTVIANVQAAVESFFDVLPTGGNININSTVYQSQIITTIQGVAGVAAVDMVTPSGDTSVSIGEIAILGSLNINLAGLV